MSNFWDLYCATCKKPGNVIHWNHGGAHLTRLIPHLPTLVKLNELRRSMEEGEQPWLDVVVRVEYGPEWQRDLIGFAVAHDGHTVLARSEVGYCYACDEADDRESTPHTWDADGKIIPGNYVSRHKDACNHCEIVYDESPAEDPPNHP